MGKKNLFLVSLLFISLFSASSISYAAAQSGPPAIQMDFANFVTPSPTPMPTPVPAAGNAGSMTPTGNAIVDWAQKIAEHLQKGNNNYYSKMLGDVCNGSNCAHKKNGPAAKCSGDVANCYWCTWLIIDAYKLAGYDIGQNLSAVGLLSDMKSKSGFGSAGASGTEELKKVKPGWAIGFGGSGHIGIVRSIQLDDRGNGSIVTIESNSDATSHTWPIVNGTIMKGGGLPVIGFAGPN